MKASTSECLGKMWKEVHFLKDTWTWSTRKLKNNSTVWSSSVAKIQAEGKFKYLTVLSLKMQLCLMNTDFLLITQIIWLFGKHSLEISLTLLKWPLTLISQIAKINGWGRVELCWFYLMVLMVLALNIQVVGLKDFYNQQTQMEE